MDTETGIWGSKEVDKGYQCDFVLPGLIARCYSSPQCVADLGCGTGHYTRIFKAFGWPLVHGYEGSKEAIDRNLYFPIYKRDLSKEVELYSNKNAYDLIICLEVGEHIPKQHEQTFIDNICKFAKKDIVLSWAIPGQKGKGHVNEQPNDYIISEMKKRDFSYNEKWSKWMRQRVFLKWFKNTIMIFYKGKDVTKER